MQEEMHRTLEKRTIRRKSSCKNGRKYKKDINYGSLYENVFSDENIQVKNNVFYCPVYLVGMFKKTSGRGRFDLSTGFGDFTIKKIPINARKYVNSS